MLAGKWPKPRGGRYGNKEKPFRNAAIWREYQTGKRYPEIAESFGITAMRVCQIVNRLKRCQSIKSDSR